MSRIPFALELRQQPFEDFRIWLLTRGSHSRFFGFLGLPALLAA